MQTSWLMHARIWCIFFWRDIYIHARRITQLIINFTLIYPVLYTILFVYLMPMAYFQDSAFPMSTVLLAGNMALLLLILSSNQNLILLFDFEHTHNTQYQITIMSGAGFVLERIIFGGCISLFLLAPTFPLIAFFAKNYIHTPSINWFGLYMVLAAGGFCTSAYHFMGACILRNIRQIRLWWIRVNLPLFILGGLWVPWFIIMKYSTALGYLVLLNPILYVTEGLRHSMLGLPYFIPWYWCAGALVGFTIIFTVISMIFFKRKMDHI